MCKFHSFKNVTADHKHSIPKLFIVNILCSVQRTVKTRSMYDAPGYKKHVY